MKKRLYLEEVEKILQDAEDQDFDGLDKEIVLTRCFVEIAKENLLETFTDEQRALYEKYIDAKQKHFDVIAEKTRATRR